MRKESMKKKRKTLKKAKISFEDKLHGWEAMVNDLQVTLKFPSENAACKALAYDKVTLSLSLPNDTLILISSVCTRPPSARPPSQ